MAWKFIAKIEPSTNAATFVGIPQTYKDLAVIFTVRTGNSTNKDVLYCLANPNTQPTSTRTLSISNVDGSGSTQPAATAVQSYFMVGYVAGSTMSTGRLGSGMMYIPNYTSNNSGNTLSYSAVNRVSTDRAVNNTSTFTTSGLGFAITSLRFQSAPTSTYQSGSVFYLYGIS